MQTYSLKQQSIHLAIKSISGMYSCGPPSRKVWPSLKRHSRPSPWASLLTALPGLRPFPEQASSHDLVFAQHVPGPGVLFRLLVTHPLPPDPAPLPECPAATLESGCLPARTVHLGNSIFPASLGSVVFPNLPS